ncbi:MAG: hypothetical protein AAF800_01980 [Planctomycetota bacterium]
MFRVTLPKGDRVMSVYLSRSGFSILQVLAVAAVIVIGIAILLPALQQPRGGGRQMSNNTQLRGIHQAFLVFSQTSKRGGGQNYFPGLDFSGQIIPNGQDSYFSGDGTDPAARLAMLLNGNFFTPEYMINPADARAVEAEPAESGDFERLTEKHYSYAMLGLATPDDQRITEWKETLNTSAPVMSDRAIGKGRDDISSLWTETGSGDWHGGVVRNDNSTSYETTAEFEQTKYGDAAANELDHLFEDAPNRPDDPATEIDERPADAFMVFEDPHTAYSAE